jgi:hypothetical protein
MVGESLSKTEKFKIMQRFKLRHLTKKWAITIRGLMRQKKGKNKNFRDIYRDISDFKNACERRKELRKLRERGSCQYQQMLSSKGV